MYGPRMDPGDIRADDLTRASSHAEKILAWVERAQDDLNEITGTGTGASGQITATVEATGKVLDVAFTPRALRLDSRTLAEEVLSAVRQAQHDAERKTRDLMREALDGFDPVEAQARFNRLLNPRSA